MSAYDRLRWWLICFGLWALLEAVAAMVGSLGADHTIVLR